jgi:hypothetical protein
MYTYPQLISQLLTSKLQRGRIAQHLSIASTTTNLHYNISITVSQTDFKTKFEQCPVLGYKSCNETNAVYVASDITY